jgi:hypothetical protein
VAARRQNSGTRSSLAASSGTSALLEPCVWNACHIVHCCPAVAHFARPALLVGVVVVDKMSLSLGRL